MATLLTTKSGAPYIQYYEGGARKTITLPRRFDKNTAEELKQIVERLIYFRDNTIPVDKRTLVWIETAQDIIRDKLSDKGLISEVQKHTCLELWSTFFEEKTGIKQTTMDMYERAQERFFLFFDKDRQISSLKPKDILEWKHYLERNGNYRQKKGLAEATIAGTFAKTKAVFNWAVQTKGWLEISPLHGINGGSFDNPDKDRFVEVEEYHRLLKACPCQEWRTIITLARIGGLRCPSELVLLRWDDIHWDKNFFRVLTPKLKYLKGKEWRYVQLFPEVRRELEALRLTYQNGKEPEFVINRYRDAKQNIITQFDRIAESAGIEKIPRPYDNMRASRATEVYAEFGAKNEEAWLGHSKKIAMKHYLMVRQGDYAKAANLELTSDTYR